MSEVISSHSPDDHEALIAWIDSLYQQSDLEVIRILSQGIIDLRAAAAESDDLL